MRAGDKCRCGSCVDPVPDSGPCSFIAQYSTNVFFFFFPALGMHLFYSAGSWCTRQIRVCSARSWCIEPDPGVQSQILVYRARSWCTDPDGEHVSLCGPGGKKHWQEMRGLLVITVSVKDMWAKHHDSQGLCPWCTGTAPAWCATVYLQGGSVSGGRVQGAGMFFVASRFFLLLGFTVLGF